MSFIWVPVSVDSVLSEKNELEARRAVFAVTAIGIIVVAVYG
jgi:hypothetical protein